MAEALGAYLKPVIDQLEGLSSQMEALGKEVKELKVADEEKIAKAVEETPAASLTQMIGSVIGREETYVDGRTKLAKEGPKETEPNQGGPTPVPFLNKRIAAQVGGGG